MNEYTAAFITALSLVLCANVYAAMLRQVGVVRFRPVLVVQAVCAAVIVGAWLWGWM